MRYALHALVGLALLLVSEVNAAWKEDKRFAEVFEKHEAKGTFVYFDPNSQDYFGYNFIRSATRFIPASTFKIPHTVIALDEKAVRNMEEVVSYGGCPQPFKAWEKDMNLTDALSVSNAAVYQQVANRIGLERMNNNIRKLCYGNMNIGYDVTRFWLDGPLKISALEQIQVIRGLIENGLGFSETAISAMSEAIEIQKGNGWRLYGKSGWQNAPKAGVGWWVGWVMRDDKRYIFALNMDIVTMDDAKKREVIGRECLELAGILPSMEAHAE